MKLTHEYLEYIDSFLMQYHKIIKDGCDLDGLLFIMHRDQAKVDSVIGLMFHEEWKDNEINEDGLKYLFKFDQWLRRWRQDMKFQHKILEEPLNDFKHYIMEEIELHEDGVF